MMAKTTQCGDRRCTLEGAERQVRTYRDGYTIHVKELSGADVDALDPSLTRIKTELDEMSEALENAKKKGAAAWEDMTDSIQAGLDRLAANYRDAVGHGTK